MPIRRHLAGALAGALATLAATGCYRPQGALMQSSGGAHTYYSTETQPMTVQLRDLRSGDVVFAMDIPPGKQLSLDFLAGDGDDPVYRPDLMRWEVWPIGTMTGKLQNALTVPPAPSRRLDVTLRPAPEYATASGDEALRADQEMNRPAWWTPKGGPLPEDPKGISNYDH